MHFSAVNHLKPAWTSLMSCYWSNIHLMFSFYSIQVLMRKQNIQISQYTRLKVLFWSKHSESWFRAVYVKSELNCTCIQSIGKPSSLQLNSSPQMIQILMWLDDTTHLQLQVKRPLHSQTFFTIGLNQSLFYLPTKTGSFYHQPQIKDICASHCLVQPINLPTQLNQKDLAKTTDHI